MTILLSLAFGFLLGGAALIFALQNNTTVSLVFLSWQFESPLAILIILAVLVGVLICALLTLPNAVRTALEMHALQRENRLLRERSIPDETVITETKTFS